MGVENLKQINVRKMLLINQAGAFLNVSWMYFWKRYKFWIVRTPTFTEKLFR